MHLRLSITAKLKCFSIFFIVIVMFQKRSFGQISALAFENSYAYVRIYLKNSDTTVSGNVMQFRANNPRNAGLISLYSDLHRYFTEGIPQSNRSYKIPHTNESGQTTNTILSLNFKDIAMVDISVIGYGMRPECLNGPNPVRELDQTCTLYFKGGTHSSAFAGGMEKGVGNMLNYFTGRFFSGSVMEKQEYLVNRICIKGSSIVFIDWKCVNAFELSESKFPELAY